MIVRHGAPLREQAVEEIRAHIVDGTYLPGVRLKEKDLCETYEVSRTVIRETLRQLESERLVRIEPNVGPIVCVLSRSEVKDLYQTREILEATAARLAASAASAAQVLELEGICDEIALADHADLQRLIVMKNRFYDALMAASGNKVIAEMLQNIQARISQLRRLTLGSPGRHEQTVQELAKVVQAIKDRDADAAFGATVAHVKSAAEIAMRHFDGTPLLPGAFAHSTTSTKEIP
ncbi:GntR family transcriptional regulator [Microcella alkaliphila]|uniref:GntR family transcriptional regulator n=1 Tax=Microcella alkaliphila TaxID=279828 RepID=A0A4Q7U0L5_9MICO|nr:GntR family transcriptional regulator [Microcella alkaliphila]RZT66407.1 GntR family transcriptional regulator [Microcella alkaliphila]